MSQQISVPNLLRETSEESYFGKLPERELFWRAGVCSKRSRQVVQFKVSGYAKVPSLCNFTRPAMPRSENKRQLPEAGRSPGIHQV